jgi:hypothetical protein
MDDGMAKCCDLNSKNARDLTASRAAWLFWYGPLAVIVAASFWPLGRNGLGAGAFAVMGIGCLVNVSRCQRLHCYFTGPLFLAAAGYAIAAQFQLVPLRTGVFLLVVLGLSCAFQCAEKPFGRYRGPAQPEDSRR